MKCLSSLACHLRMKKQIEKKGYGIRLAEWLKEGHRSSLIRLNTYSSSLSSFICLRNNSVRNKKGRMHEKNIIDCSCSYLTGDLNLFVSSCSFQYYTMLFAVLNQSDFSSH